MEQSVSRGCGLNLTEYVQEPSKSTTLSKDGFLYGFVVRLTLLTLMIDTIVTLMFEEFIGAAHRYETGMKYGSILLLLLMAYSSRA